MTRPNRSDHASRARLLCKKFGYPEALSDLLDEIVHLADSLLDDVIGIVLSPSISTGDFLWSHSGGKLHYLSDIDGFVFARFDAPEADAFRTALLDLQRDQGGPLFKIDLSLSAPEALDSIEPSFQMNETALAGFELVGENLLHRFPTHFDPRKSRQAFLYNLWKPLATTEPTSRAQSIARLLLDIPLLATSESGVCRPGHRDRAEWFLTEKPAPFGLHTGLNHAVQLALDSRLNPPGSLEILEPELIPAVEAMIQFLDDTLQPECGATSQLVRGFTTWLPPRKLRRLLGELRTLFRRPEKLFSDLRWLTRRKEAIAGAAALGLLQVDSFTRDQRSELADRLSEFSRRPRVDPDATNFKQQARDQYTAGMSELYPSLAVEVDSAHDP